MSSSYIVEPQESATKKDDTLIIVVNDDGTISVDQETLQNLIMNQSNANVSVVRVGQSEGDATNGDLTFTVDPPAFAADGQNYTQTSATPDIVDPFMEMDPEQLERLETALQSEQAKQILGENVAAMLDMLTVEEQQNSIRYSIELDHCYTSRTSPADPPPLDPLPVAQSPDDEKMEFVPSVASPPSQLVPEAADESKLSSPVKASLKKPVGRPRKMPLSVASPPSASKGPASPRSVPDSPKARLEEDNDSQMSTTESSESEPSDDDVDFGPRGPRRGGVRARGGRKGLTTRGGSMAARRPGRPSKMDVDQVRRLNLEMAAAVDEMKPVKVESPDSAAGRLKKQIRTMGGKKKEELAPAPPPPVEPPPPPEKPLQTTNQVKASLINANMIKGDMILTKPGQSRNNQKVYFVQKKIVVKPSELKTLTIKKSPPVVVAKPVKVIPNQIQPKLATTEDGKVITVMTKPLPPPLEAPSPLVEAPPPPEPPTVPDASPPAPRHSPKHSPKDSGSPPAKLKPVEVKEVKKEKKKEPEKVEEPKPVEVKPTETPKKHPKKDVKKSPAVLPDDLGPALFSTPDIIRRVGSVSEAKAPELPGTPTMTQPLDAITETTPQTLESPMMPVKSDFPALGPEVRPEADLLAPQPDITDQVDTTNLLDPEKGEQKEPTADDLHSALDPVSTSSEDVARPTVDTVRNIISEQSGIEGNEHLLATLEIEASKHEEELLAEALLLQEQLDVDLTDPSALDGAAAAAISEPLLATPEFDTSMLPAPTTPEKPPESPAPLQDTPVTSTMEAKKKDGKEPIQIVRGGRVITLPPIEAPATRSKRQQSKTDTSPKIQETPKREEKLHRQQNQLKKLEEMDSEMEDDDEEENSDSEDDPNRLWCICKRPHNNRFMICCDVCEDWFHGKCVHVTKAMGQQMEEQGIEWVCPNCSKKKSDDPKSKLKGHRTPETSPQTVKTNPSTPESAEKPARREPEVPPPGAVTQCVVCKREARQSSVYCSDSCILAHAQEMLTKDKTPTPQKTPGKDRADARVIVFERKTGKILTGTDAPTRSNLQNWLREHPTFEAVRSNNLNTIQIGGKTVTAIQTSAAGKIMKPMQPNQVKMIYAKVAGSKQTILAPSNKKITIVSSQVKSPQPKPVVKPLPVLKQTTIKTLPPAKSPATPKVAVKKPEQKPSTSVQKQIQKPQTKKPEPEPIRMNVRKTLAEHLTTRIRETEDLKLTDEEISDLALNIELELYKYFKDTGAKYKAKYRSLAFNIKDTKNLTLFRKIADRSLTPDAVVRLSPEEMASQELAEWREKETKHQLEMIKKNELDLMAQAKSIVVKTHKGEQIIENDGGLGAVDPKTPVQDIVSVLNSAENTSSDILEEKEETTSSSIEERKVSKHEEKKKKKSKDKDRDKEGHRSREREHKDKRDRSSSRGRKHRSRDRSRDRRKSKDSKRDKEKDSHREKDRDRSREKDKKDKDRRRSKSHKSHKDHKDYKDKDKKRDSEDERKIKTEDKKKESTPPPSDKPIEDRLWRHVEEETTTNTIDGNDSDVSDREPSSTVNIKTPDINEEPEKEKEATTEAESQELPTPQVKEPAKGQSQTVWRGFVSMVDVAKFFITAQEISGCAKDLMDDLPDTIEVVGRISHETVWDYISKMKKTGSKEILVIRLTAANDEEKIPYITLYSYLNSRSRLGVIGSVSKNIKDFYIMPFSSQSQVPPILSPLISPGLEENRPHLLLGIIVRNKRKRPLASTLPQIPAKLPKKEEKAYTPPPVHAPKEKLPQPEKLHEENPVTQTTLNSLNKAHVGMSRTNLMDSATISKIVPELSSKLDLTSSPGKAADDDGDEPYSPGGIDDEPEEFLKLSTTTSLLPSAKNSSDLQRKMEELNRQIEEQKQQIQSISSSFLGESVATLPGLGLDPPAGDDEAYSPTDTRSFTPPPLPKFAQPILDKVGDITIPPNLQEILANVKRQESTKVDPYLPSKPGASFLTSVNKPEKTYTPTTVASKSTLRSLSDLDLIKKAEEELAAVAAASEPGPSLELPADELPDALYSPEVKARASDQPKPPGLEDEDLPTFPTTPPHVDGTRNNRSPKFVPKSGVVVSVKRKISDDGGSVSPSKTPRTKSRWGQGPAD